MKDYYQTFINTHTTNTHSIAASKNNVGYNIPYFLLNTSQALDHL